MSTPTFGELYPYLLEKPEYAGILSWTHADPPHHAPTLDLAVRDAVLACPHRGPEGGLVLTEAEQSGCCGGGPERTACGLGKGARPGRVTLRDCLDCQANAVN